MKHSQCSKMDISLLADSEKMTLLVSDDGIGFDMEEKIKSGKGLGLGSMEKRARDIGGELKIQTEPGKGTKVIFSLPIPS
jgi:two-component system sensor histidine kinase DegS